MREFQSSSRRVLITTDLLTYWPEAINSDCLTNRASYTHRIGHGGQFDHKGLATNVVTAEGRKSLEDTEALYWISIEEMPLSLVDLIWVAVLLPGPNQDSVLESWRTAGVGRKGSRGMNALFFFFSLWINITFSGKKNQSLRVLECKRDFHNNVLPQCLN